jgi:hypothetical protein
MKLASARPGGAGAGRVKAGGLATGGRPAVLEGLKRVGPQLDTEKPPGLAKVWGTQLYE